MKAVRAPTAAIQCRTASAVAVLTKQQIGRSESAVFFTGAFFENHPGVSCLHTIQTVGSQEAAGSASKRPASRYR